MLSRKCHANHSKQPQFCGKWQQKKEKVVCGNLSQLADSVRLATPLARFGKIVRTASKQRVGSSSLPGRAKGLSETAARLLFFNFVERLRERCVWRYLLKTSSTLVLGLLIVLSITNRPSLSS